VPIAIGSDSHVCRNAMEELRWLEYGQRLHLQRRNVGASPDTGRSATAARLFDAALHAGAAAAGQMQWGLRTGARADMAVLNDKACGLLGIPDAYLLDAAMFACDNTVVRDVFVAGELVIEDGRHARQEAIAIAFTAAMEGLWTLPPISPAP
jgi:formimidoylglutamate deiminase